MSGEMTIEKIMDRKPQLPAWKLIMAWSDYDTRSLWIGIGWTPQGAYVRIHRHRCDAQPLERTGKRWFTNSGVFDEYEERGDGTPEEALRIWREICKPELKRHTAFEVGIRLSDGKWYRYVEDALDAGILTLYEATLMGAEFTPEEIEKWSANG